MNVLKMYSIKCIKNIYFSKKKRSFTNESPYIFPERVMVRIEKN